MELSHTINLNYHVLSNNEKKKNERDEQAFFGSMWNTERRKGRGSKVHSCVNALKRQGWRKRGREEGIEREGY